jgi:hypothetical protein
LLTTQLPRRRLTRRTSMLDLIRTGAAGCDGVSSALHPRPGSHDRAARTSTMRPPAWMSPASALRAGLSWMTVTSRPPGGIRSPPRFRFSSSRPSAPCFGSSASALGLHPIYARRAAMSSSARPWVAAGRRSSERRSGLTTWRPRFFREASDFGSVGREFSAARMGT